MLFLSLEESGAGGVQGRQCAREAVGEEVDDPAHVEFVQVGQYGLRDDQVRPGGVRGHLRCPRLVRHRCCDHRPPGAVCGEVPAQADHVGQVEAEPPGAAVVDAFVACVEPGADLGHGGVGMGGQEVRHPPVEEKGAQQCAGEAGESVEASERPL
ncbi:hypothetical protein [Streptomyces sp. NPDC017260]|uniref:hypothetical protein n=1 Tax=unclassified Streptomyces TaxID=2593676 RepID=UPI0037BB6F8A